MKVKETAQKIDFKRIALYALITMIIVISLSIMGLKFYFNSQRLEKLVLPRLEEMIKREISIKSIDLQFWPQLGVALEGVKVANPEGFSKESLAQLDSFLLSVELMPLLEHKIKIKEVTLTKPQINLIKRADGRTNYQLFSSQADSEGENSSTQQKSSNFKLNLDDLRIKEGSLTYDDLAKQGNIEINGINSSNKLDVDGKNKIVTTAGRLEIAEIKLADLAQLKDELDFSLAHQLRFNLAQKTIEAKKLDLALNGFDLANTFQLEFLKDGFRFKELQSQSGDSNLEIGVLTKSESRLHFSLEGMIYLTELCNKLPLKKGYNLTGELNPSLMGQFNIDDLPHDLSSLELLGSINISDVALNNKSADKLSAVNAEIKVEPRRIKIASLQTNLLDSSLSGTASIEEWRPLVESVLQESSANEGQIDLALKVDKIDLEKWQNNFAASGNETAEDKESSLADAVPDWPLSGSLRVDRIEYQGLELRDFVTRIESVNDLLKLLELRFKTAQGEVSGQGEMNLRTKKPSYDGDLSIKEMEVNHLLSSLTQFNDKLYGGLNLDLNLSGSGLKVGELLNSINLAGNLIVDKTRLSGEKIVGQLNSYFPIFNDTELKLGKLKGKIKLTDGRVKFEQVKTVSQGDQIELNGYSTLGGDLNYRINYLLGVQKSKEMDLKHKELLYAPDTERVQLKFELSGKTTAPKLKWDKKQLEEKIKKKVKAEVKEEEKKVEDKAKEEKKKIEDEVKEKLEEKKDELKDKVKNLF